MKKTKHKTRSHWLYIFQLNCRSSLKIRILGQQMKIKMKIEHTTKTSCIWLNNQNLCGGYSIPIFKYDLLQPYITSDSSKISTTAQFRYVDHVDDVNLLKYPADQYVHTSIPLNILCGLLPTSNARKIASLHGVSAGSRCTPAQQSFLSCLLKIFKNFCSRKK